MQEIDYQRLAAAIAEHIPAPACPNGMTREDSDTLREFAHALRSARATAWATFIRVLVLGALATFAAGIWYRVVEAFRP